MTPRVPSLPLVSQNLGIVFRFSFSVLVVLIGSPTNSACARSSIRYFMVLSPLSTTARRMWGHISSWALPAFASEGVMPKQRLKALVKDSGLSQPYRSATSITLSLPAAMSSAARLKRRRLRYSAGLTVNTTSNIRQKWKSEQLASPAAFSISAVPSGLSSR